MSNLIRSHILGSEDSENNPVTKRSLLNSEYPSSKRQKLSDEMTDTANQKRPNFSALSSSPNGINKSASLVNIKPGAAKKLVIKNFKGASIHLCSGAFCAHHNLLYFKV